MLKHAILAGLIVVASVVSAPMAAAQTTIFLVRHAERADGGGGGMAADPALSAVGRARAQSLAGMLKDTKLTAVFSTELKRTQQTAAPTAQAQHLTVTTVPATKTADLVEKLKAATGAVLVVGHSNTVPEVLTALGITPPVTINDADYDNLFVVITGAQPKMVRLRYR
jgi:phosphohistidine phosphatase SixA